MEALRSDTHPLTGVVRRAGPRRVEFSRRGGDWQPLVRGQVVYVGDRIRTGPRSRARIELDDRDEAANVGPTIINIGHSSEVMISHFDRPEARGDERSAIGVLIQGILRALSAGWGSRSAFSVRVGTSLCGIRGTEIAVSYDAQQDSAEYWLHHGDAYLRDRHGTEFTLTPATVTTVTAGERASERSFVAADYAAIVAGTEAGLSRDQALSIAGDGLGAGPGARVGPRPGGGISDAHLVFVASNFRDGGGASRMGSNARAAHSAFEAVQNAARRNNILSLQLGLGGKAFADLNSAVERIGTEGFASAGWRPASWMVDCVHCDNPAKCYVYTEIDALDLPSGSMSKKRRIFVMEQHDSRWLNMVQIPPGDQYDRNVPICAWK